MFLNRLVRGVCGVLIVSSSLALLISSLTDYPSLAACGAFLGALVGGTMLGVAWGEIRGRNIEAEQVLSPQDRGYS